MEPELAYLEELTERLRVLLRGNLLGVYAGGSHALGDFDRARSDLDVAAVVGKSLGEAEKERIVESLRYERLAVPARGLELVVYRRGRTDFELNLNSGPGLAFRADWEPVASERHWFVIDRSILLRRGITLYGPPVAELLPEPGRDEVLAGLAEALRWFAREEPENPSAVLNAMRALRFAREGEWVSKGTTGQWARERPGEELVGEALAARAQGEKLDADRVRPFLEDVVRALEDA